MNEKLNLSFVPAFEWVNSIHHHRFSRFLGQTQHGIRVSGPSRCRLVPPGPRFRAVTACRSCRLAPIFARVPRVAGPNHFPVAVAISLHRVQDQPLTRPARAGLK